MDSATPLSKQPYFIRALYEWCVDSGLTPYILVAVNAATFVPMQYVKDGQIILSLNPEAINRLEMTNTHISFQARFSGIIKDIEIPISQVLAIYAQETGDGMSFDTPTVFTDKNTASVQPDPALSASPTQPSAPQKTDPAASKAVFKRLK